METEPYKIGDMVRLKSGGPVMTIEGIQHSRVDLGQWLILAWFAGDELRQHQTYSNAVNRASKPDDA